MRIHEQRSAASAVSQPGRITGAARRPALAPFKRRRPMQISATKIWIVLGVLGLGLIFAAAPWN
jgi:hypothetical protein